MAALTGKHVRNLMKNPLVLRFAGASQQFNYCSRSLHQNHYVGILLRPSPKQAQKTWRFGSRLRSISTTSAVFNANSNNVLLWKSTENPDAPIVSTPYIPEPPAFPESPVTAQDVIAAVGDPSFASQGLGGWTPVGLVENCFEFLNTTAGLPWWLAIAAGTLTIRFLMLPVFVMSQRNASKMHNNMPQLQVLQMKMSEARKTGNALMAAKYGQDIMMFMKEKDISPFKNMLAPLCQAPIFISFFFALREMANLPLESMKTGGMLWFTDLTVADPFYILPLITCTTVLLTIELGAEGAIQGPNMQLMRYIMRGIPFIIFPFTVNFPAAILCYWVTSNFISLGLVGLLRIPAVSTVFKIPKRARHSPSDLPSQSKGFVDGFKEAMTNTKISREMSERARIDEIRFRKAGIGPVQKTYPYDPTKQRSPPPHAAQAKSREEK